MSPDPDELCAKHDLVPEATEEDRLEVRIDVRDRIPGEGGVLGHPAVHVAV